MSLPTCFVYQNVTSHMFWLFSLPRFECIFSSVFMGIFASSVGLKVVQTHCHSKLVDVVHFICEVKERGTLVPVAGSFQHSARWFLECVVVSKCLSGESDGATDAHCWLIQFVLTIYSYKLFTHSNNYKCRIQLPTWPEKINVLMWQIKFGNILLTQIYFGWSFEISSNTEAFC